MQRIQRLICSEWFLLLLITILAAALRLYALDRLPPGLYHDEAYNGLDALDVIRGQRPIFFEANNGREPLFIYLTALSVSFLGRNPLAIRLVAALLGTLTIPATYLMARELLGRREALLTALVTATTFWHLNLSRVGFRVVSLPLFTALCLWFFVRGLHGKRWHDFALGGFCLGLSFYTYLAARFLPLAFLLLVFYWLWRHQPIHWRGLFLFFTSALIVALPLLLYAARNLDLFLARSAQVSVFNPSINRGDFAGALLHHIVKTLGMFNWRGDFIPRHNMPYRPVFDLAMGLFFLLGAGTSLRRARHRQEHALLWLSFVVMLMPTILAEGAPHFLRATGILPVLFVFPALGLRTLWEMLRSRMQGQVASLLLALLLGLSLYTTVNDYFFRHMRSEAVYYNFESGAVELGAEINRFLGTGWSQGSGWKVLEQAPSPQHRVYLDDRLWRDWASLRYLVPETSSLVLLGPTSLTAPEAMDEVRIIVWPYAEHSQYLTLLPREGLISVQEGPLERGDLEAKARLLCLTYQAMPPQDIPLNVGARFEQGIKLLGYQLRSERQGTCLRLFWHAGDVLDADYTVFVHWKRGQQMVDQSDSYPAQGHYPTHLWRAGDIIVDDHLLTAAVPSAGDSISVGLYQLQTMKRLQVLDSSGASVADAVAITLP